jgi:predicted ATPase
MNLNFLQFDWSDYVVIQLTENVMNQESQLQDDTDIDKCMEAFLEACGANDLEEPAEEMNDESIDEQLRSLLFSPDLDEFESSAPFLPNTAQFTGCSTDSTNKSIVGHTPVNYLNIYSAEIRCPGSGTRNNDGATTTAKQTLQRIFSLALVFYELFSGGEAPPSNLHDLASSYGAFSSLPNLTLVAGYDDDRGTSQEPKRRERPSGSGKMVGLCELSFEYMKLMGFPGPLCQLIFNMLECVYGDLSGDECYTNITDVMLDLQLMMNKPKFFYGLDIHELSSHGLQLHDISIPREEELQSILSSYRCCLSGSSNFAAIQGESGSGKSWLAHRVGSLLIEEGGLFLMGKYDQMQQSKPFSALAAALDQYCDVLISQMESDWAKVVIDKLQFTLGRDACHLATMLPKLSQILNVSSQESAPFGSDNDIMNAMRRIHFLLCQFVEIISTTSIVSVTLFLDDVQWVDEASVLVLNRILRREPKQFFFLCCYRDEEMKAGHPFLKMLENLQTFGINSTMIQLDCVTEDVLNEAISQLLCLSPRLVRSLSSIVFRKSKGNPLFVSQLLLSLNRDGLLRINLNRKRWVWNEEKILSTKLPDNVALCFTNGIKQLPIVVQVALHTLSMFGASVRVDCITWLESQLKIILTEPLKIAVSEGLVNIIRGSYKFAHDRIQEASYQMIQDHDRLSNHLIYGQCLVKIAIETGDDTMFFTAVNQINLGGPSAVTNREEYLTMAQHNWVAGKRSMAMSDFNTAHSFFDHSISFLRKNHWRDNYEFSLDLYECAARSALATGNSQSLQIVCDQTMRHAKCFEDKLSIYYILISSLALASKIQEALEKNLSVLSQLGEGITNNLSQEELDRQTHSTLASLIRVTSEVNIANHKVNTESNKLAAMKFLAQLHILAYLAQPVLHPFVVLKMIQITVAHGQFKSVILFCRSIHLTKHRSSL